MRFGQSVAVKFVNSTKHVFWLCSDQKLWYRWPLMDRTGLGRGPQGSPAGDTGLVKMAVATTYEEAQQKLLTGAKVSQL